MILKLFNKLFPKKCIVCGDISIDNVCVKCIPRKADITKFGDGLFYVYTYSDSVKKLIHLLKFEKEKSLAKVFSSKLDSNFFKNYDLVIPVPCHWLRIIVRGFFHLETLFGSVPNFKKGIVIRKRFTGSLFKKGRIERENTMKDVFKVIRQDELKDKRILIIDDIYTTGTTYRELKKELERYSPLIIEGLFLCRA